MKILIPTDFSPCADYTLEYVIRLMNKVNCTFSLLHTYEIPRFTTGEIVSINDQLKLAADEKLIALKKQAELISNNSYHTFHHLSLHGDFLRVVNRILREEDIDLLAISGSDQNRTNSLEHKMESKAYAKHISEVTNCPVLIVPIAKDDSYQIPLQPNKAV